MRIDVTGRAPRVLVAPDSFKGTMTARQVATALAEGIHEAGGAPVMLPLADGGEGTAAVLRQAVGGQVIRGWAEDPLGGQVMAELVWNPVTRTAIVETASATGLHLITPSPAHAWEASSAGTGQLLAACAALGADLVLLGVGGSACTDGGVGALRALRAAGGLNRCRVQVLCDVVTPFEDAATVFGPQKGADTATVERLTRRLDRLAGQLPRDPRGILRTGAAGGLSGALWSAYSAELVSGIDAVLDLLEADRVLQNVDLVVTGEGRLDAQTGQGKVIDGVLRRARAAGIPVVAVVGQHALDDAEWARLGLAGVHVAGDKAALREVGHQLIGREL